MILVITNRVSRVVLGLGCDRGVGVAGRMVRSVMHEQRR